MPMDALCLINTAEQTGDWKTRECAEKLLLVRARGVLRALPPPEPQEQPSRKARNKEADTRQRFQKFLRSDWTELPEKEREGGRSLQHTKTPAGKASKIVGALAVGNLTKAMAQHP